MSVLSNTLYASLQIPNLITKEEIQNWPSLPLDHTDPKYSTGSVKLATGRKNTTYIYTLVKLLALLPSVVEEPTTEKPLFLNTATGEDF